MAVTYTTRRGLPAPDNSDPVNQGAARIRDLVAALDNGGPHRSAAGVVAFSTGALNAGAHFNVVIPFPAGRFSVAPILTVSVVGGLNDLYLTAVVRDTSTTFATVTLVNGSTHNVPSGSRSISWIATQATASAAAD